MAKKRWKHNLPISEWTVKELQESIDTHKYLIEIHRNAGIKSNSAMFDRLNQYLAEKSSRIGQKKK